MPNLIDYRTNSSYRDWMNPNLQAWSDSSPKLEKYDIVVSDNLIEVLEYRNDTILSGSFFWHEALHAIPSNKKAYAISLLKKYRPKMISSSLFAPEYLESYTQLNYVGIYDSPLIKNNFKENRDSLLISCGKGGNMDSKIRSLINEFSVKSRPVSGVVFIEPSLYLDNMPPWIKPADYSDSMYKVVGAAIIRPGIGTVSDCILYKIKMFMVFEPENNEMQFNAQKISENNLGQVFNKVPDAWLSSIEFMKAKLWKNYSNNFISCDIDGANQASKIILSQ